MLLLQSKVEQCSGANEKTKAKGPKLCMKSIGKKTQSKSEFFSAQLIRCDSFFFLKCWLLISAFKLDGQTLKPKLRT